MSVKLTTERAKKLLDKTNVELISAINSILDEPNMKDVDYLEDAKIIYQFIIERNIGTVDKLKITHCGLAQLVYIPVYPSTVDFAKPITKNGICDDFDTLVAMKFLQTKISASNRGIQFGLTLTQMARLLKRKKCYYSGIVFDSIHSLSLDRKDNTIGYVDGNVVPCSRIVNSIKEHVLENNHVNSNMSTKEIVKMMKSFIDYAEEREKETLSV